MSKTARQILKELDKLARKNENFYMFETCPEMEQLILDWVECARENHGMARAEAYRRLNKVAAMNFEHRHNKTMWKEFYLYRDGEYRLLLAYSMHGEGKDEERTTIELLAFENGCSQEEIEIEYRFEAAV